MLLRLLEWILTKVNSTLMCQWHLLALLSKSHRTAFCNPYGQHHKGSPGFSASVITSGFFFFFSEAFLRNGCKLTSNGLERICFVGRRGLIIFWATKIHLDLSEGWKLIKLWAPIQKVFDQEMNSFIQGQWPYKLMGSWD